MHLNADILVGLHHKNDYFYRYYYRFFDLKKIIKKIFKTAFCCNTKQIEAKKQVDITNIANACKK